MSRFWIFSPWLMANEVDLDLLAENCALLNASEVYEAVQAAGTRWKNFPIARLALTMEDFNFDCFSRESCTFVSKRLREAMALPPDAAQFLEVDLTESAARVQANDYKIMNIAVLEDAIDVSSSDLAMGRLAPGSPEIVMSHGDLRVAPSFHPKYEMFHDRAVRGHVLCTDALALRVLKAGCTGVRFFDVRQFRFGRLNPFRTLRGVERDGDWDPSRGVLETELIEAIS